MNSVQNSQMFDVLEMLEACKSVIYSVARAYEVDAEDLAQDLAVFMLEHPAPHNPKAYYRVKVRYMAINRAPRDLRLDAPLTQDSPKGSLAEILPAGPVGLEEDHNIEDARAQALHTALAKMPLDEQEHLCSTYGINAYAPTDTGARLQARSHGPRSKNTITKTAHRRIRKDQELLRAVQETSSASAV